MSKGFVGLVSLLAAGLASAPAQDITGDWVGTLSRPAGAVQLAMHISKVDSGLKGTLDSSAHGISGMLLDSLQFGGSKLSFNLNAFQASYAGSVNADASAIEGTLTADAGPMPLNFRRGTAAKVERKPAKPTDIDGDWIGSLADGDQSAAVAIHIVNTEDGLTATLDQPSAHVKGAPASSVLRKDNSISMEWKVFGSKYEGKIAEDKSAIEGNVMQGGNVVPLTLARSK